MGIAWALKLLDQDERITGRPVAQRQGVPAAVGRPGVERRSRARAADRPRAPHPGLRGRRRHEQRRLHPASRRSDDPEQDVGRRSTRASTASRWPPSPRPAAGATWSSTASATPTSRSRSSTRCGSWRAAASRKAPTTSTGPAWRPAALFLLLGIACVRDRAELALATIGAFGGAGRRAAAVAIPARRVAGNLSRPARRLLLLPTHRNWRLAFLWEGIGR